MTIRTRFAPSPTGHLHIGGVRTALFSYLYARQQKGEFLLRIEDTDRERSCPEFEQEIIEALQWLNLKWENGIVRQSERIARYEECARLLEEKDLAYRESGENGIAVKFRMPQRSFSFHDLVREEVRFDTSLFDDLVIMKSDGFPTYHFACVVDDHDMEITHVIRGEDHLSNTPRQIMLFEALGWKPPKYAHLPLILGQDGTPLSKRHGSVALQAYKEGGYLAEGILNYLALLGWGSDNNQEIFSLDDLAKKFSLKKITKAGARFNVEKLDWINAQHIKALAPDVWRKELHGFSSEKSMMNEQWEKLTILYQPRCKTLKEFESQTAFMTQTSLNYDKQTVEKLLNDKRVVESLGRWLAEARPLNFDHPLDIEQLTRTLAEGAGLKAGDLIHPLRFALTGTTVSPGLFELMSAAGKDLCLSRVVSLLAFKESA